MNLIPPYHEGCMAVITRDDRIDLHACPDCLQDRKELDDYQLPVGYCRLFNSEKPKNKKKGEK